MQFKESEAAQERSILNKINAAKKKWNHRLGPGGYEVARPKWDLAEQQMMDAGVTPVTLSWPPGSGLGSMRMGGRWTQRHARFWSGQVLKSPPIVYLLQ